MCSCGTKYDKLEKVYFGVFWGEVGTIRKRVMGRLDWEFGLDMYTLLNLK